MTERDVIDLIKIWAFIAIAVFTAILIIIGVTGCAALEHVPWELIEDVVIDELEEAPDPDPTPEISPSLPAYRVPEFASIQYDSALPLGISLCTPGYLPGATPTSYAGSIAISHVIWTNCVNGKTYRVDHGDPQMKFESPGSADNWCDYGSYVYTTREAVPTADGTRQGRVTVPFGRKGKWACFIGGRWTKNRGAGWLAVTVERSGRKETHWFEWDQRGHGLTPEGKPHGGYYDVQVTQCIVWEE